MSPLVLTLGLGAAVVLLALLGPRILRQATPALVRVPRLAIAALLGILLISIATLLAIGPVLAWLGPGPALLPGPAAEVCQRCLAAANPFDAGARGTTIPAALLLAVPAALAVTLAAGGVVHLLRRARLSRDEAGALLARAHRTRLQGVDAWLVSSEQRFALTFPRRHGGIVLSTAAVDALDDDELAAVLRHEEAHLHQRHHDISGLMTALATFLRWVPAVRAAEQALAHYLEIAADHAARRHAGTPALVSALIKLGERQEPAASREAVALALHAAGPERIRQLVRPAGGRSGIAPAVMIGGYLLVLGLASIAAHLPYATAALTGC